MRATTHTTSVQLQSSGNTVAGVGVADGSGAGVFIQGSSNRVIGSTIGSLDGRTAAPNQIGIEVISQSNVIGGTTAGTGNVILGNAGNGVHLECNGSPVTGNVIKGNLIGTAHDGQRAVPNHGMGVNLRGNTVAGLTVSGNMIEPGTSSPGNAYTPVSHALQ